MKAEKKGIFTTKQNKSQKYKDNNEEKNREKRQKINMTPLPWKEKNTETFTS